jgi:regulation of enolase protein 1 (concanavalin A-like superfamily)
MASCTTVDALHSIEWRQGWWLHRPPHVAIIKGRLVMQAAKGSDAWRTTSYGFVRDSAHALLTDLPDGWAMQVSFLADFTEQFDQAGIMVRTDETRWTKAGIEYSDGSLQASAVVTDGLSDWSVAAVPSFAGEEVTVRVSRSGNALTIRIRSGSDPWRLLRVAPIDPAATAYAGPYCCAPERDGLAVTFTGWSAGPAEAALHDH